MQAASPESIREYCKLLHHFNGFGSLTSTQLFYKASNFLNLAKILILLFWFISFKRLGFLSFIYTGLETSSDTQEAATNLKNNSTNYHYVHY